MAQSAREEILGKLRAASKKNIPQRPCPPPLTENSLEGEEMINHLIEKLTAEAYTPYRVKDNREALEKLTQIAKEEGLKCVIMSTDEVIVSLDLPLWGEKNNVKVLIPGQFTDRKSFKDAVFNTAEAAVTGVNFVVAETGSLGLIHNKDQARLLTLAPILHIVFIPVKIVVPVLEAVLENVFAERGKLPSQFLYITGPSMTGDIKGHLFRGMHGPRRVIAIVIG